MAHDVQRVIPMAVPHVSTHAACASPPLPSTTSRLLASLPSLSLSTRLPPLTQQPLHDRRSTLHVCSSYTSDASNTPAPPYTSTPPSTAAPLPITRMHPSPCIHSLHSLPRFLHPLPRFLHLLPLSLTRRVRL